MTESQSFHNLSNILGDHAYELHSIFAMRAILNYSAILYLYNEQFLLFVSRFILIQNDDLSWFSRSFLSKRGDHFTS